MGLLRTNDPDTGKPHTARAVSAWLLTEHGLRVSHMTVLRLQAALDERGDKLIVAALREELRDAVAPAKRRLVAASERLAVLCATEKNTQKLAAGVRALTAVLHEVSELGGVAAPLKVDVTSDGKPVTTIALCWPDAAPAHPNDPAPEPSPATA